MNSIMQEIYHYLLDGIIEQNPEFINGLPSESELARRFSTNRMNANRAVKALEKTGAVYRIKGKGTFVDKNIDIETVKKLKHPASKTIYVLASYDGSDNAYWDETSFNALERIVKPRGLSVVYRDIDPSHSLSNLSAVISELEVNNAFALIIFFGIKDQKYILDNSALFVDSPCPVYIMNRDGLHIPVDIFNSISVDYYGDGITLGKMLRDYDKENIFFLGHKREHKLWSVNRYQGLITGAEGVSDPEKAIIKYLHANSAENHQHICERIRREPGKVVVVAANNSYAASFIDFAGEHSLITPDDFQLIAFENQPAYRSYNLTSFAPPAERIGEIFGRMICEKSWINTEEEKLSLKVKSFLVERETFKINRIYNFSDRLSEKL